MCVRACVRACVRVCVCVCVCVCVRARVCESGLSVRLVPGYLCLIQDFEGCVCPFLSTHCVLLSVALLGFLASLLQSSSPHSGFTLLMHAKLTICMPKFEVLS